MSKCKFSISYDQLQKTKTCPDSLLEELNIARMQLKELSDQVARAAGYEDYLGAMLETEMVAAAAQDLGTQKVDSDVEVVHDSSSKDLAIATLVVVGGQKQAAAARSSGTSEPRQSWPG